MKLRINELRMGGEKTFYRNKTKPKQTKRKKKGEKKS